MADAIVKLVEDTVVVKIDGASLLESVVARANAAVAAAEAEADEAAAQAMIATAAAESMTPPLEADGLVGARALPAPPSRAASVVGDTFVMPSAGETVVPGQLTADELADPTATVHLVLDIVSGSAGTAFTGALLRWYDATNTQTGPDVALAKAATSILLVAAKPADAVRFEAHFQPAVDSVVRHLAISIGTPARPTTDPWYLSLLGAGIAENDPQPIPFQVKDFSSVNWDHLQQRLIVPNGGGSLDLYLPNGPRDGDVVWMLFSSPLEPTAWLQYVNARYGTSGSKGDGYTSQIIRLGANRWAVAHYIQSLDADDDFSALRFTWNNPGAATYAYDIAFFVGPNPPFRARASRVTEAAITDAQARARGRPVITFAGDSTEDNSDPFAPDPRQALEERFGDEVILRDLATPGDTLVQMAVTAGLLPVTVSLDGGYIPADTNPVAITDWPVGYDAITALSFANPNFDPYCWLVGVFGYLSSDGTWGGATGRSPVAGHFFFTPVEAPPWPVEVPDGTQLVLRSARESKGSLVVFPISTVNGVGGFANDNVAFVDAVFAAAEDPSLLVGFVGLNPNPYDTGAATLAAFAAKSYYAQLFDLNVMSANTVAEAMAVTGWNWASGEHAAWLAGTLGIPESMRTSDHFHPYTPAGVYVLAKNWRTAPQVAAHIAALH